MHESTGNDDTPVNTQDDSLVLPSSTDIPLVNLESPQEQIITIPVKHPHVTNANLRQITQPKPPPNKPKRTAKRRKLLPLPTPKAASAPNDPLIKKPGRTARRRLGYIADEIKQSSLRDLRTLWDNIAKSNHKLLFIRYRPYGQTTYKWYLVTVDLEETDPILARQTGTYYVQWYIRHPDDSKSKPQSECRYWPEIREIDTDGEFGSYVSYKPERAYTMVKNYPNKYGIYGLEVNLPTDMLVGPFDFAAGTPTSNGRYRVAPEEWNKLRLIPSTFDTDIDTIDMIVPIVG
jgi:hypothetical protein